jgi:hypothetical protein
LRDLVNRQMVDVLFVPIELERCHYESFSSCLASNESSRLAFPFRSGQISWDRSYFRAATI